MILVLIQIVFLVHPHFVGSSSHLLQLVPGLYGTSSGSEELHFMLEDSDVVYFHMCLLCRPWTSVQYVCEIIMIMTWFIVCFQWSTDSLPLGHQALVTHISFSTPRGVLQSKLPFSASGLEILPYPVPFFTSLVWSVGGFIWNHTCMRYRHTRDYWSKPGLEPPITCLPYIQVRCSTNWANRAQSASGHAGGTVRPKLLPGPGQQLTRKP